MEMPLGNKFMYPVMNLVLLQGGGEGFKAHCMMRPVAIKSGPMPSLWTRWVGCQLTVGSILPNKYYVDNFFKTTPSAGPILIMKDQKQGQRSKDDVSSGDNNEEGGEGLGWWRQT